jgi:hypothetical protein
MSRHHLLAAVVAAAALLGHVDTVAAQTIGSFRWNLAPFCNVVTVTVVQVGGAFSLAGSDDQCGLQSPTAVEGTLVLSPGGTVTGHLIGATTNSANPFMTRVSLNTGNFNGTWQDDRNNSGTFVFNPATAPGVARPAQIAIELWAYVISNAGLHASSGGITVTHPATGEYCVVIAKRGSHKAAQATLADPGGTKIVSVGTGHGSACNPLVTTTQDAIPVYVRTTANVPIDGNFTIVIPMK